MMSAPEIENDWALFLDLDGTVLDIAPSPGQVVVPAGLPATLERVQRGQGGALAFVSGRSLEDIDRLFGSFRPAASFEHGVGIRFPSGAIETDPHVPPLPESWIRGVEDAVKDWAGVRLEKKRYSITIHYRLAPELEDKVEALASSFAGNHEGFGIVAAKKAFEIRPKGVTKGRAVQVLMEGHPFRGRVPVFVGDDLTDEDGIDMACRLGGFGLRVATEFEGEPAAVRDWLGRAAALSG